MWVLAGLIYAGGKFLYETFWTPLDDFLLGFIENISQNTSIGSSLYDLVEKIISSLESILPFPLDMPMFYYVFGVGVGFAVFYWLIVAFFKFLELIIPL